MSEPVLEEIPAAEPAEVAEPTEPAPCAAVVSEPHVPEKKRGRPPGAKNKPKAEPKAPKPKPRPPSPVRDDSPQRTLDQMTPEDVARSMLDLLAQRQTARRDAKRTLYQSFLA